MREKDKLIIRDLAKAYMEEATSEKQQRMNARMKATNDLKIVRPPVIIDEIPWYQMNIDDALTCTCEDATARKCEFELRKDLYRRKYIKADTLFDPFYRVTKRIEETGIGIEVKENIRRTDDTNNIISHEYEDILEDEESLEKIKIPTFAARPDIDEKNMDFFTDLFGDSMPVKLCGAPIVYYAPWDRIARYRGMEAIMFDLYDRPEYLHKIRQKFHDIMVARLDFIEKNSTVDTSPTKLHCTPAAVSGLAEEGWKGTWLRAMAQPFSDVSPQMHKEFDVDYVNKFADRFAYTYYGCCEPLDKKIPVLKSIKNLRKIGVTPWADLESSAEQIGKDYVMARKPNPAYVAVHTDPAVVRKETEDTVKMCIKYGCPCEFVLKDISTVSHRPENIIAWASEVSDVLDKYYGEE